MTDAAQLHKKFVEKHKWIDEQLVSDFSSQSDSVLTVALSVSRDLCIKPSTSWPSKYQDALLYKLHSWRSRGWSWCVFNMVVWEPIILSIL